VDLFARFNQDVAIVSGDVVADHASTGATGEERITINSSSNPVLRAGTYYISLALFTSNVAVTGTLTATVNSGSAPPPSGSVLTSGTPRTLFFNPVSTPTLFNANNSYVIDVPPNSSRLDVQLSSAVAGADLDLFVSYGKDNIVGNEDIVADYRSDGPSGNERITITPQSSPGLRPGRYYISVAVYTTGTNVMGTLVATVNGGEQPSPGSPSVLTSGQTSRFSLPAVSSPTLFNGNQSYQIRVPEGMTQMRIRLASDNPALDVDVFARYQADNGVDERGEIVADYRAQGPTGNETIAISSSSSPPLRPGLYYISLASFAQAPATGTITVTLANDILSLPSGSVLMSARPVMYALPAVDAPVLFAGSAAHRITVERGHTSLRVSVTGTGAAVFVRRGVQPVVVDGRMYADFSSTNGDDILVEGDSLNPGVYYVALAQSTTGIEASGTLTATLTGGVDSSNGEPVLGAAVSPKPSAEQRFNLADTKAAPDQDAAPVKRSLAFKKRQPMKLQSN
jgi:hypothetical protein